MAACTKEIYWYYYIVVSLVTFFGGLIVLVPARFIWYALHNKSTNKQSWTEKHTEFHCFSRMRAQAANILSGHGKFSKAMIVFVWLVNMGSVVLYLTEATSYNRDNCGEVIGDTTQYVWLAFSCFFVAHYIIRLVAAPDKCYMWADLYSIVDHFTIGPLFVGLYLNRNWLGLRFLRLLHLLQVPDILQLLHIIKSRNSIRLVQVASIFSSIWLVSSGFVHICENNGDPFSNYDNGQRLTYWECVYWLLVTMSTVGFGEISPSTDIGRAFIVVFIMGSFAMFTTVIPELATALGRNAKYHKPYKRTYGKKHIIVCGHITTETVTNFIKNFMHEDSHSENIDVVFVNKNKPGLEMEAFFKRHFNDVKFVQGTVMDLKTLQGVKLRYADACLIIANRTAADPDAEDTANTMRATAVKNFNPDVKVIIQLLEYRNKLNLLHIPKWRWSQGGDEVICISELKNGILAQNCLAPGISTLLSNLFTNRSARRSHSTEWLDLYKNGAGNEIYTEDFSDAFVGMTFTQVASICLRQFGIILVAVYIKKRNGGTKLKVNPGSNCTITAQTGGFFIAQSPNQVKHVLTYPGRIGGHNFPGIPTSLVPNGKSTANEKQHSPNMSSLVQLPSTSDDEMQLEYLDSVGSRLAHYSESSPAEIMLETPAPNGNKEELLDTTGMFHWCPTRLIETATLERGELHNLNFNGHVIVCLSASRDSPESGLINFITPLRSSCLKVSELRDIVIVSNLDHVAREWREISNFPGIYILPRGRHTRTDLREVSISKCSMCVIMTTGGHSDVDQTLIDNEAILTTLTIKSMFGMNLEKRVRSVGVLTNPEAFRRGIGVTGDIPTITELENSQSVVYVDPDDDDDPTVPIYLTTPYACGKTFVSSVLDSLLSCTYLNPDVLTLTRALITGGETAEFEKILSEGLGIVRMNTDLSSARPRCRLAQLSLACGPLEKLKHNNMYGELFTQALQTHDILCLGLYRLMDPHAKDPRDRKRVVVCNPDYDLQIYTSDRVFVLQPHTMSYSPHSSNDSTAGNVLAHKKSTGDEHAEENSNDPVFFSLDGTTENQSCKM